MSMLRFSAEASLYISSGHYRTGEHALSLFRETNRLRPAMERGEVPIEVPGETIPVKSCPSGWDRIGGICWPPPQTEPPSGGGSGPGTPGVPGQPNGEGPHGPGGETPEPEPPRPEPMSQVGRAWARQCEAERDPVHCCYQKKDSCVSQFPEATNTCNEYGEACISRVRDVGKAWAAQCKGKENPLQCCRSKRDSCIEQFPKHQDLCDKYSNRCQLDVIS